MSTLENLAGTALQLEAGGIYVIECERDLTKERLEDLRAEVARRGKELGVRFIVLGAGLKIARNAPRVSPTPLADWAQVNNPAEVLVIAGGHHEFRAFANSVEGPKKVRESTRRVLTPDTTYQFCTNAQGLAGDNFTSILKYGSGWAKAFEPDVLRQLERQAEINALRVKSDA